MDVVIQATRVFKENWNATTRFVVNIGGTRSTKTYSILQVLILIALQSEDPLIISIIRKSLPALRMSVMRDFFEILVNMDLYITENHNHTENTYMLNNTLFEFFSIDDAQKRRGSKRDYMFLNESNELTYEDFFQLNVRTSTRVFLDFNPSETFWYNDKIIGRDDVTIIHSTYLDNPFINEDQAKEIERLKYTDEQYYKIYTLGEFAGNMNVVYSYKTIDKIPDEAKFIGMGLDFGFTNDPTAIIEVWRYINNLYFEEFMWEKGKTNDEIAGRLTEGGVDRYTEIFADIEPKSIEEIHRFGFNIKKTEGKQIKLGIDILKRYNLNVLSSSLNLIKEFNNYKWIKDKNGNSLNMPVDDFNHGLDAIRYVALSKLKQGTVGKYNISII